MVRTKKYQLWPKGMDFSTKIQQLMAAVEEHFKLVPTMGRDRQSDNVFSVFIDEHDHIMYESYEEFMVNFKTLSKYSSFSCNVYLREKKVSKPSSFGLWIKYNITSVEITTHGESSAFVEKAQELAKDILGLYNIVRLDGDTKDKKNLYPIIFISRHFDDIANMYGNDLKCFLELLGFRVLEGEEYGTQPIPEKVKNRIDQQDILVAIVSGDRDHDWITAEIGFAVGKNKHVIMLKEEGVDFNPTILGKDYGYIEFKKLFVHTSYCKVLTAFRTVGIRGIF